MANRSAPTNAKLATPTLEIYKGIKHGCTIVGTSVTQVPATNLNYRKAIIIQNKHASNIVYIGGGIPYMIEGVRGEVYTDGDHDKRSLRWFPSAYGTNEWYLATAADGDPGLSTITYLYYRTSGSTTETLATSGSPGSLGTEHYWGYGDSSVENGWSTLYMQTNGSLDANRPNKRYEHILAYYFTLTAGDATLTGGVELGPRDSIGRTYDGTVKVFAIASAATTAVGTEELV